MLASAGWLSVALLPLKKRAKAGGKWGEEAEGPGVGVGGSGRQEGTEGRRRGFSVGCSWQCSGAFLYSVLDLEMFPFPLIDQLQAAKLSSVLLLACSSFLHFLYKEMRGGVGQNEGGGYSVRQHHLKGAQCAAREEITAASDLGPVTSFFFFCSPLPPFQSYFFTFPTPFLFRLILFIP